MLLSSIYQATPFPAHALKKNIFFDVDFGVKKQIEMWFIVVCSLINNEYASLLFFQTFFFILFLHINAKGFKRKSDP